MINHVFVPTIGNRCAVVGCGKTREDHPETGKIERAAHSWEMTCSRDHASLQTRQFPTPEGVEWAICPECKVQLEASANKRV